MTKTTLPKASEADRKWYLLDATERPAGRLAVRVAALLRGKTKRDFAPHMDVGDFVIVTNASKVKLTGNKGETKLYQKYTGYNSGLKKTKASAMRERHPEYIVTHAVKNMLPKNRLSRTLYRRLKVYPGAEHPHGAQQPIALEQ